MKYWCYIDESWRDGLHEKIGVLAATVGTAADFEKINRAMYRARRKYMGEEQAKDRTSELKGTKLFAQNSFKMQEKHGHSKNLWLAREVLEAAKDSSIRYIGVTVYGTKQPSLLAPKAKDLARPFRELCIRLMAAIPPKEKGIMVFDQRVGAQEDISIAISNYLAGMPDNHSLLPHPLVGVSNVHAGLQLADLAAFILGKWAEGDNRFQPFYKYLTASQMEGLSKRNTKLYGLVRLQHEEDERFTIRKERTRPSTTK